MNISIIHNYSGEKLEKFKQLNIISYTKFVPDNNEIFNEEGSSINIRVLTGEIVNLGTDDVNIICFDSKQENSLNWISRISNLIVTDPGPFHILVTDDLHLEAQELIYFKDKVRLPSWESTFIKCKSNDEQLIALDILLKSLCIKGLVCMDYSDAMLVTNRLSKRGTFHFIKGHSEESLKENLRIYCQEAKPVKKRGKESYLIIFNIPYTSGLQFLSDLLDIFYNRIGDNTNIAFNAYINETNDFSVGFFICELENNAENKNKI